MSTPQGFEIEPGARVTLVRRHRGYALAVVLDEGPFGHEEAQERLRQAQLVISGLVSRAEAANKLGLSVQQVDNLRREGKLKSRDGMITYSSILEELSRRGNG